VKSELKELFRTVLICVSLHFSSHNLRFFDTRVRVSFGLYVNRGVTAESLSLGQQPMPPFCKENEVLRPATQPKKYAHGIALMP
jgi:hypothetical protein